MGGGLYLEGVSRFKSWFLNAPGLIHSGPYYQNFTVYTKKSCTSSKLCLQCYYFKNIFQVDAFSGRSYTFKQIKILVKKFGSALVKRGFQKGDVFAIFLPNMPEYSIVFHGVIFLGGIVTSLNPMYTEDEVLYQLKDSKAKFLITIPQLASQAKAVASRAGLKNVYVFGEAEGCESVLPFLADDGSQFPEHVSVRPKEDLFLLPYSSGTTGFPKGVVLTHYNVISAITMLSQEKFFDVTQKEDAAVLGLLPFYHSFGMIVAMGLCLLHGAKVVCMPKFDAEVLLKTIQIHKVNLYTVIMFLKWLSA